MKYLLSPLFITVILLFHFNVYSQVGPVEVDLISNGNRLNADIYPTSSDGIHPTLIFMHGFPGGDGDPRGFSNQLSAKGINILVFNYQGTWGSEGTYSIESSMEDVGSAIEFLKTPDIIEKFGIDTCNIVVGGWSYGGAIALTSAIYNPDVKRIISLAGADESVFGRLLQSDPDFYNMMYQMFESVVFPKGATKCDLNLLFKTWLKNIDNYDQVKHADALIDRDILFVGGWRDQNIVIEYHILPLYRKLQELKAKKVEIKVFDTDHNFSNVKEELVETLSNWILSNSQMDIN